MCFSSSKFATLAFLLLPPLARVAAQHAVVFDLHRDDQDFTAGLLESGTVMAAVTSREAPVAGCRVRPLGILRYEPVATTAFAARWFPRGADADVGVDLRPHPPRHLPGW